MAWTKKNEKRPGGNQPFHALRESMRLRPDESIVTPAEQVATNPEIDLIAAAYYSTGDEAFLWAAQEQRQRRGQDPIASPPKPLPESKDFPLIPYHQLSRASLDRLSATLNDSLAKHLESLGVEPKLARTVTIRFQLPYLEKHGRYYSAKEDHQSRIDYDEYAAFLVMDRGAWCAPRSAELRDIAWDETEGDNYIKNQYSRFPVNPEYQKQLRIVESEVAKLATSIIKKSYAADNSDNRKTPSRLFNCLTTDNSHPEAVTWLGVTTGSERLTPLEVAKLMAKQCKKTAPIDLSTFQREVATRNTQRSSHSPYAIDEKRWFDRFHHLPETSSEAELSNGSAFALGTMVERMIQSKLQQLGISKHLCQSLLFQMFTYNGELSPRFRADLYQAKSAHDKNSWDQNDGDWPWVVNAEGVPIEKAPPEWLHPAKTLHHIQNYLYQLLHIDKVPWDEKAWSGYYDMKFGDAGGYSPLKIAEAVNRFCNEYGGKSLDQSIDLTPFYAEFLHRHPGQFTHRYPEMIDQFLPSGDDIRLRLKGQRELEGRLSFAPAGPTASGTLPAK